MITTPFGFPPHDWLRSAIAFTLALGVHVGLAAGVVIMPSQEIEPPQVDGGFEVVDLSAFGVAAMPEPEPVEEEEVVEEAPPPKPDPEPEPIPEPEPEPMPLPKPQPKPEPKPEPEPEPEPEPKPEPKKVEAPKPKPKPKAQPQTEAVGSQQAFVPPSSTAAYLRNPKPSYPAMAQRRGMEGLVLLYVEVSKKGAPLSITIKQSSGYTLLDKAALRAVKAWRFAPAKRGGIPVSAGVEVPIRFSLKNT